MNFMPNSVLSSRLSPAAIGLGANLGDAIPALEGALQAVADTPGITLLQTSAWYQSKPLGGPPQPDYFNGCAIVETDLSPHALLAVLMEVEQQFGRERIVRWGARTLDLDLILYGDRVIDTFDLIVPHPRMHERAFVLMPLAEIAPQWLNPQSGQTIEQQLQTVDTTIVWKLPEIVYS